jgi:hypothetical protein
MNSIRKTCLNTDVIKLKCYKSDTRYSGNT